MTLKSLSIAAALLTGTIGFASKADAQVIYRSGGTYYTPATTNYYPSSSGVVYSSGYTPYYTSSNGVIVSGYSTPVYSSNYYTPSYSNSYYGNYPYSGNYGNYGNYGNWGRANNLNWDSNNIISTPFYGVGTNGVRVGGRRFVRW